MTSILLYYSQTCVKQPARGSGQTGRLPQVASEYRCGKCWHIFSYYGNCDNCECKVETFQLSSFIYIHKTGL